MDCRAKFFPVQCFSWKGSHFPCKIPGIFWIFRGLFELDLLL